ncbi:MAG: 30S ribosomal protein S6 [Rhodospirillaceae bacterium]|jgi:small subunit ribosomal protein S6|nr:30S ribosomal protein S6 [Rhodospirillaceae bacterium]
MSFYECVIIARQDLSSQQVEVMIEKLINIFTTNECQVSNHEYWGLRNISYRMKKNKKGHYILFKIDAIPSVMKEFERQMSINEDIIRYMSIHVNKLEESPSIVMQNKNQHDDNSSPKNNTYSNENSTLAAKEM